MLYLPLVYSNIMPEDIDAVAEFLGTSDRLTNGPILELCEKLNSL